MFVCATAREARAYAEALGGSLTTAAEEDVIFAAAELAPEPLPRWPMPSEAEQHGRIMRAVGNHPENKLLANTGKVWTADAAPSGRVCNYGWFVRGNAPIWRGITTYRTASGLDGARVIQPLASAHNLDHRDYSQHVRVIRRTAAPLPPVPPVDGPPPEYAHPLYVPAVKTPLDHSTATRAVLHAMRTVAAVQPDAQALAILVAHSALETANWRSMVCYNVGNSKSSQNFLHTYFRTGENVNGRTVMFDPPHIWKEHEPAKARAERVLQTRFRAFRSAEEGMSHHARLIAGTRYRPALIAALRGDVVTFSRLLFAGGYYTGASKDPVKWYTDALVNRMVEIGSLLLAREAL